MRRCLLLCVVLFACDEGPNFEVSGPWVSVSMWDELPQTDGDSVEHRAGSW